MVLLLPATTSLTLPSQGENRPPWASLAITRLAFINSLFIYPNMGLSPPVEVQLLNPGDAGSCFLCLFPSSVPYIGASGSALLWFQQ